MQGPNGNAEQHSRGSSEDISVVIPDPWWEAYGGDRVTHIMSGMEAIALKEHRSGNMDIENRCTASMCG